MISLTKSFRIGLMFSILLITACATSRLEQGAKLADAGQGLVLIKVGDVPDEIRDANLVIRQFNPSTGELSKPPYFFHDRDKFAYITLRSNFNSGTHVNKTNYFTSEVAPGSYVFTFLRLVDVKTTLICMRPKTIAFEVKPGMITFLGEYMVNRFGVGMVGFHKDQALAEIASHPNLATLPMITGFRNANIMSGEPGNQECFAEDARVEIASTP